MKWLYFVIALTIISSSCSQSALSEKLSVSDSLVIHFNAPNRDTIIKTVSTTERKAINKLVGWVDSDETEKYTCGYDGNMIFYKEGKEILPIVFKYREKDCGHFLLELDGKLVSMRMHSEAIDFLESLEQGKTWY